MNLEKLLGVLERYVLYFTIAFLPVFVLSNFTSPYIVPKEALLVSGVCLVIVLWVVRMVVKGSLSFSVGKFDLGVALLAIAYLVSTFLATPNKMEAYLLPGTTTFVLGGVALYFLVNQLNDKGKKGAGVAFFIGAMLLALSSIFSSIGAFSKIPQLPALIRDSAFSPMGGAIPSIILLAVALVFAFGLLIKEIDVTRKLFYGVSLAILIMGMVVLVGSALPGKPQAPKFASMQTSWEITIEALKKSPLIGAGPSNYLTAFNLFRPVTYNQTDLWQVRFTTGSNLYFTLITETGFAGLVALLVLLASIYKLLSKNFKVDFENYSLVLMLILFALLPVSPALFVFFFILLGLLSKSQDKIVTLNVASGDTGSFASSRAPAVIVGIPFLVGVVAIFIFGSRVLAAEITFKKSLDALASDNAKNTYDQMTKAIGENPRVDRYHASLAQVDLALASSIASKKDISDADRTAITQLVQQAISEGKNTVSLNPTRSGNWEVLAQIYRSIMPFAQGADQFAVQSYTQAVALDPTNPNLRIALGGVYYALGRYDDAIETFKLAALAKGDLANAHYNLAIAYREKKDYDTAISEMNNVLSLVDKNSNDFSVAKSALEDLQKKKTAAAESTDNLQAPQKNPVSNVKPPITLPEEATPPASNQ